MQNVSMMYLKFYILFHNCSLLDCVSSISYDGVATQTVIAKNIHVALSKRVLIKVISKRRWLDVEANTEIEWLKRTLNKSRYVNSCS